MLNKGLKSFEATNKVAKKNIQILFEITLSNLKTNGEVDEQGELFGNTLNNFTFSIDGFDTITQIALLNIETAYGCASAEIEVFIDPLVPTINMSNSGNAWNYDGDPADIILII